MIHSQIKSRTHFSTFPEWTHSDLLGGPKSGSGSTYTLNSSSKVIGHLLLTCWIEPPLRLTPILYGGDVDNRFIKLLFVYCLCQFISWYNSGQII